MNVISKGKKNINENQKDISRFCLTDKSYFIIEKKETVTILFDSTKLKKLIGCCCNHEATKSVGKSNISVRRAKE